MTERWHDYLDRQVAARPDAPSFSDADGQLWTYAELGEASAALARDLADLSVRAGDRVVILAENCRAAVAALFACSRLGAIAVPVNARQTPREVDRILAHARPAVVLATSSVSEDARGHADRLGATSLAGPYGALRVAQPFSSAPEAHDDVAVLLYTTGTTGAPKGVMLTHANLLFGGRTSATLRGMTPSDLIYGVLPMTHVFGLSSMVTAAVFGGAHVRLEPRFSPSRLYAALKDGVTLLSAVPQMHALLMQHVKEQGYDRLGSDSLRYVSSGAAPLDPAWKRKAEAFYGVALQNGYGMTETTAGATVTLSKIGDPDISVGPALPGVELRIDETVPGGGGGVGEVLTRGPHIMKGYYNNPEATKAALDSDGWMHTGDIGRIDEAGLLHILGRSKELIIHGGFNVYPPEVEAVISDHPQVVQSAVVGWMVDGDEKVVAFVQVAQDDPVEETDLRHFVADRLAGYKRPSKYVFATALPAAPTGKILKHLLLDHFSEEF